MPQPTLEEFWSLLAKSGLTDAGTVAALRGEQAASPAACGGDTVPGVARWLVERGVLTRWQAKRLAVGNLGPFFLGDYRLLTRHDRGGDALLFTARHEPSGRTVDVVVLNTKRCRQIDVWTEIVQRATAASQANDPMLSRTWSLEQHESGRMIVCEHVEGTSLADELEQHGPLSAMQAGVLVSQVARAVAELHRLGSVHGSLSPDVLRREPPPGGVPRTGRVRLLQFPLAADPHRVPLRPWNDDAELAALGKAAAYLAPELMLPEAVCDPRSDIYSIGAILHALLTGAPPCWAGTAEATLRRAAFGEGPAPLGPPAVGDALAAVVARLMARDPVERFETAAAAADAIAAALGLAGGLATAPARSRSAAPRADGPRAEPTPPAGPQPPVVEELPDFSGLAAKTPAPSAAEVEFAVAPAASAAPRPAVAAPRSGGRRRAAGLQWIGGGITLAILAGTLALVWSKLDRGDKPSSKPVAAAPAPRPTPSTKPTADKPADTGVSGWGERPPRPGGNEEQAPRPPGDGQATPPTAPPSRQLVVDDPKLPWAAPTEGPRPRLAYLPPGSQLVLLARPGALVADAEGALFLEALGPQAKAALARLAGWCGCEVADIEFVQAGWQAGSGDDVLGGCVVRLAAGRTVVSGEEARRAAWGATEAAEVDGETIHRGRPVSFWVPSGESGRVLVVAAESAGGGPAAGPAAGADSLIEQIVRQGVAARAGKPEALQAELPRDLEELVAMLDADRHVTLFGSPHYLLTQGQTVLTGPLAKLAEPLKDLFGDAVQAAALSAHFADNCYLEMDAIATLDVPAKRMAPDLAGRMERLAEEVERYCAALDPSPYGRVLVMRLPQMLRLVVANTRHGAEGKGVILNACLPRHAGHNLALAAELALAQSPGAAAAPKPGPAAAATDALGRLGRKITLVFAKDTLEKSIQMISDEIGVPMDILGPDLQLEGITKNQSFALEARDQPAREVLREILAKANPDGKLVYVVRKEEGVETILVTTRAAVQKRGDTLPPGQEAVPAAEDEGKDQGKGKKEKEKP